MTKYGAIRTAIDGIVFDSKAEAKHYAMLKLRIAAKEIHSLELQPAYPIVINGVKVCTVKLDFRYMEGGKHVVVDVKGMDTPVSRLKRKLLKAVHGVDVLIIK